jgi:hypothetical protein
MCSVYFMLNTVILVMFTKIGHYSLSKSEAKPGWSILLIWQVINHVSTRHLIWREGMTLCYRLLQFFDKFCMT